MNYNEMNPRHRKQAEKLAAAIFQVMTEPTQWRMIVELNTIMKQYENDPDPLHNYYMIDGAMIDEENAQPGCDMVPLPNGFMTVCGDFAIDCGHLGATRDVHPQAVTKWVLQMITRDRVRNIWYESY